MAGNSTLPGLGTRGVAKPETGVKQRREPARYAVTNRRPELDGAPVETLRSNLAAAPVDLAAYAVPVRAVLFAKPATCRFVLGVVRGDFTFCGDRATVVAAGQLTYCACCAARIGWTKPQAEPPRFGERPMLAAWRPQRAKS